MSIKAVLLIIFAILFITLSVLVGAASEAPQTQWSSTAYYGYSASCVIQTEDGGYAIGGSNATYSIEGRGYTGFRTVLVKTDLEGNMQWSKTYEPELGVTGSPRSVFQTSDLGYVLSGHNGWLLKTDSQGNLQWNRTIEPQAYYDVIQASDGGYVLGGFEEPSESYSEISYLQKIGENGNSLWLETYEAPIFSMGVHLHALVETGDGGYAVAGSWAGSYWFAKVDSKGVLLWNRTYTYENYWRVSEPRINSIARTEDGGYILAGGDGGAAWLIKVDSLGNEQWNRAYLDGQFFRSVAQSADCGYVMAGWYGDAWLVKVDSSGNVSWIASYVDTGGPRSSYSVVAAADGGYAVAGQLANSLWLAKFAPEIASSPNGESSETFPLSLIAVSIFIVAVIAIGFLFYFRKSKH